MWKQFVYRLSKTVFQNQIRNRSQNRSRLESETNSTSSLLEQSTTTDLLSQGRRPLTHIGGYRPNEPAGLIVKDLDVLDEKLQTAINMGPVRGNELLLAVIDGTIRNMPEGDRRRAWNACLRAVKMMELKEMELKAANASETGAIQPSGEFRHSSGEMPRHASANYVSELALLTQNMSNLGGGDRKAAWDLIFDRLSDPLRPLSEDQKGHLARRSRIAGSPRPSGFHVQAA